MRILAAISILFMLTKFSSGQSLNHLIKQSDLALKNGYNEVFIEQKNPSKKTVTFTSSIYHKKDKHIYITDSVVSIKNKDTVLMVFINKKEMLISAPLDLNLKVKNRKEQPKIEFKYNLDKSLNNDTIQLHKILNNKTLASYLFVKNNLVEIRAKQGANELKTTILKSSKKPLVDLPSLRTYFIVKNGSIQPQKAYGDYKINNLYLN